VSVYVLFFGSVADRQGKRECSLPIDDNMTLEGVLRAVGCEHLKPLLVAVNQEQVHDLAYTVKDGDEVALMPPFAGG